VIIVENEESGPTPKKERVIIPRMALMR